MAYRLPPLATVRVFEAAARHLSFTRAADELGMTQAAVSYQIKLLEERVGTPLFLRKTRQVELTEAGARLAPAVSHAMETLDAAFAAARREAQEALTVATISTFATLWLVPRLGTFQQRHPEIAIRLDVSMNLTDFQREAVDVAVRWGDGNWPGLTSHRLLDLQFAPMLSPRLAEAAGGLREPADLLRLPLIDPGDPWWPIWFDSVGVRFTPPAKPAVKFGAQHLEARAAVAGQGVAILSPMFYAQELALGQLVMPFPHLAAQDGKAYWLVYPDGRKSQPKIRAFRNWIFDELAEDAAVGSEPGQ